MFAGPVVGSVDGGGNGGAQRGTAASTTAPQASCHETYRGVVRALVCLYVHMILYIHMIFYVSLFLFHTVLSICVCELDLVVVC